MRRKPCKTCMWWWDLYDTGERICYRKESPFFHKETEKGCERHESLKYERRALALGYYKGNKKEDRTE